MATLTGEQVDEYVKDGGASCPWCAGTDFDGEQVDIDERGFPGEASQAVTCNGCGRRWLKVYKLDGFHVLDDEEHPNEDEAQAEAELEEEPAKRREERLAEEVLAAEYMGEHVAVGKVVCAECGSDDVFAYIEERTRYYPPEKAVWPLFDDEEGTFDYRMAVEVAEEQGSKKDSDTTEADWYCRNCGAGCMKVVPADK
jgi:hypothetical protein